jgi:hypothetical protein
MLHFTLLQRKTNKIHTLRFDYNNVFNIQGHAHVSGFFGPTSRGKQMFKHQLYLLIISKMRPHIGDDNGKNANSELFQLFLKIQHNTMTCSV